MKVLESIKLVQFFLFESEEFRTGRITGLFGMNGAGKSALLDAVQIALFGANQRLVSLNSKADDSSSSVRTIRSYCLGQTTPDVSSRVRDQATTYITLVWRDTATQEPTSMGVCISASFSTPGHTVLGRYLLPGTELAMLDHLDTHDGQAVPADWGVFRARVQKRFLGPAGESPLVPDADRFIKKVLFELRRAQTVMDDDAFKRALKFGLRMRFEKATVDDVIRRHVLEDRRTDIDEFRKTSETFRDLKRLFDDVAQRIAEAKAIDAEYAKAEADFAKAATWRVTAKDVELERCTQAVNACQQALDEAQEKLGEIDEELRATKDEQERTEAEHREVDGELRAHKSHLAAGTANKQLSDATGALAAGLSHLSQTLRLVVGRLERVLVADRELARSRPLVAEATAPQPLLDDTLRRRVEADLEAIRQVNDDLDGLKADAQRATQVDDARDALARARGAEADLLKQVSDALALCQAVDAVVRARQQSAKEAENESHAALKRAEGALERLERGRAPLSDSVDRLLNELLDQGLSPQPVCDLVRVKDAAWQPVIEAYLGPNREALMLPTSEEEQRAFDIYREMRGARSVYGVKLFGKQRQKPRDAAAGSVAELLTGEDPAAVAFLRAKFGGLKRAQSRDEALGQWALTADGMLDQGTEFERLRPVLPADLKLGGKSASKEERESIERRIKECRRQYEDAQRVNRRLLELLYELRDVVGAELLMQSLRKDWASVLGALSHIATAMEALQLTADESYVRLVNEERDLQQALQKLAQKRSELDTSRGRAEATARQASQALDRAQAEVETARRHSDEARNEPGFDADLAGKYWDELLKKFGQDYASMRNHCDVQVRSRERAANDRVTATATQLERFISQHREHPPLQYERDWRVAWAWLKELLQRLEGTELHTRQEEMARAYEAARSTFRNDVAMKLGDNIKRMEKYFRTLNQALENCPPFTNGERYRFRYRTKPEYQGLLTFVQNVHDGMADNDLFGGPGDVPEMFRSLLEERVVTGTAATPNPLDDYRYFFEFDVEIRRVGRHEAKDAEDSAEERKLIGMLSSRLRSGSGGEHTAPLYVMAGAALAAAYRLNASDPDHNGMGLMLIDEAFLRMDDNNIAATMQYLLDLGLQVFVAGTGSNLDILTPFLDRYYDLARDEQTNTVFASGHDVTEEGRHLARADLLEFHPELVEAETRRVLERLGQPQGAGT